MSLFCSFSFYLTAVKIASVFLPIYVSVNGIMKMHKIIIGYIFTASKIATSECIVGNFLLGNRCKLNDRQLKFVIFR